MMRTFCNCKFKEAEESTRKKKIIRVLGVATPLTHVATPSCSREGIICWPWRSYATYPRSYDKSGSDDAFCSFTWRRYASFGKYLRQITYLSSVLVLLGLIL